MFEGIVGALTALLLVAGPLAVVVTEAVDFIRNLIDEPNKMPSWLWNVVALVIGVALALGWGINLVAAVIAAIPALSDMAGTRNTWGTVLTGLILGAMAGFWHDKMAQWSAAAHSRIVPYTGTTTSV